MVYKILFVIFLVLGLLGLAFELWFFLSKKGRKKLTTSFYKTLRSKENDQEYKFLLMFVIIPLLPFLFLYMSYESFTSIESSLKEDKAHREWRRSFKQDWVKTFINRLPSSHSLNKKQESNSKTRGIIKPPLSILLQHEEWHAVWNYRLYRKGGLAKTYADIKTVICIYTWSSKVRTKYYRVTPGNTVYRNYVHALAVAFNFKTSKVVPLKYWDHYWIDEPYPIWEIGQRKSTWKKLISKVKIWIDNL